MNNIYSLFVHKLIYFILMTFIGLSYCCRADISSDKLISLNFEQADVTTILHALADEQSVNLIMQTPSNPLISLKLQEVPWSTAFNSVLDTAHLQAKMLNNIIYISQKPDQLTILEQHKQQEKNKLYDQPLAYLSVTLDHHDGQYIANLIKEHALLTERGKIFFDKQSATIMVHDVVASFAAIRKLISAFDKAQPQIQISASIVTMSRESLSSFGVKWGYMGHPAQGINHIDIGLPVANSSLQLGMTVAHLAGNLLNLELAALEAENQVEIIANPTLLTTNLMPASIRQGTEIPYEIASANNSGNTIEFKQAVLGLEVTPRVLNHNNIELSLHISQNAAGQAIKRADGGEALTIDTQEIETHVIVKHGQTLVLGGIFQHSKIHHQRQVPGLGKLPLLGGLFRYDEQKEQRRELVIFITPQIISNTDKAGIPS